MKTEIYVQARMGSTRLPRKVLLPVLGKPLLFYLMERLKKVKHAQDCVVLTTGLEQDDVIAEFCKEHGYSCFRGSDEDVLARYYAAAKERNADAIVRITGDCPLIDPNVVDEVIEVFQKAYPEFDYVSNTLQRTFPRGMDTEIFSFEALEKAFQTASNPSEREHVTLHMYRNPDIFRMENVASPIDLSHHRWTVDTIEDFQLIKLIIENSKPNFHLKNILKLLNHHPEWIKINSQIKQKGV